MKKKINDLEVKNNLNNMVSNSEDSELSISPNEPYFNKCWIKNKNLHKVFEYSDYLTKYTFLKRAIFSFMAGFLVGIAYLVYFICKGTLGNVAGTILGSALFPFAIFGILYWGGNLFTSNTLMIVSVIRKKIKLQYYAIQLFLTWFFNLCGSLIAMGMAWLLFNSESFLAVKAQAVNTALHKLEMPWYSMLPSAFFCNVLVAGCVYGYLTIASNTVKFMFVYLVIFFFAVSGFQHCIANQFSITLGVSYFEDPEVMEAYFNSWKSSHPNASVEEISNMENHLNSLTQRWGWGAFFLYNQIGVTVFNAASGIFLPSIYMIAEYKKKDKNNI